MIHLMYDHALSLLFPLIGTRKGKRKVFLSPLFFSNVVLPISWIDLELPSTPSHSSPWRPFLFFFLGWGEGGAPFGAHSMYIHTLVILEGGRFFFNDRIG